MKVFSRLIHDLDSTNKTTQKLDAIARFLREAEETDKLWLLALFSGKRPRRPVNSALMRQWALEVVDIPEWLFLESYAAVGDLSETIALILPPPVTQIHRNLGEWMTIITALHDKTESEKKEFVLQAWQGLTLTERFIFNKLLGGSFRIGVSAKTLINAIAKHYAIDANIVSHSIMGDWKMNEVEFDKLIRGAYANTQLSKPYPFCLAYALEKEPTELGDIDEWQIEYKWDGIRGQFIKRQGELFIWSRGEELVTEQFPEIVSALRTWPGDFVLDGEILVVREGKVCGFTDLQKRLNRKVITKKLQEEYPIHVYAYDLLEWNNDDWRNKPLAERRAQLEALFHHNAATEHLHLPSLLVASEWAEVAELRANSRAINSEGLMLKHRHSIYHTGRKKGDWWKWKVDPLSIDAVLIYAQKGSGRRSAFYTDYTFAVKSGDQLVTIAKAYSGLTDKEIKEVSRFVTKNAIEKFGPVRTVKPELVFEIAFEGTGWSSRHKSGVALRFPRIVRWRKDKTVTEIDDIEEIKKLIK